MNIIKECEDLVVAYNSGNTDVFDRINDLAEILAKKHNVKRYEIFIFNDDDYVELSSIVYTK
jgi:hypothetical protein